MRVWLDWFADWLVGALILCCELAIGGFWVCDFVFVALDLVCVL